MPAAPVVDLLRHGATGFSGFRGSLDDALISEGWQQMEKAVAGMRWDAIMSSPRLRCAAFARALAAKLHVALQLDERLAELDFGAWEGKTVEELMRHEPEALQAFWRDPEHHAPPGGEPMSVFSSRVSAAWDGLQQQYAGQHVLLVTHGGVIRHLICQVRGLPLSGFLSLDVPHGSLHRLAVGASKISA